MRQCDQVRASRLRAALAAGRTALGIHCFSGAPAVIEAAGTGGLDFITLDQEHSPNGSGAVAAAVRAADSVGVDLLLRAPVLDRRLGSLLDLGLAGLVVPQASVARMRQAALLSRFAPAGERGACPAVRAGGYGVADWPAFAAAINREFLLIALIEDPDGLEEVEAIAALPAVDALFVGAFDLAVALGVPPGELRSPGLLPPFERIAAAAAASGKAVMASLGGESGDYGSWLQEKGVRIVSGGADLQIVHRAARRLRTQLEGEPA